MRSDAFRLNLVEKSGGHCALMLASKFSLNSKIIIPFNFKSHRILNDCTF